MKQYRCVYVNFSDLSYAEVAWGLLEAGHECELLNLNCSISEFYEPEYEQCIHFLCEYRADAVFTMDYSPTVSEACQKLGIPYAAWLWDMPIQALFHPSILNEVNYFFCFDHVQEAELKEKGCSNVFYQPLAANVTRSSAITITEDDKKNFSCDISFVGSLYADKGALFDEYLRAVSPQSQLELNQLIAGNFGRWDGEPHAYHEMSDELVSELLRVSGSSPESTTGIENRTYFETKVISYRLAFLERMGILSALAEYHPVLYTKGKTVAIPGVAIRPPVDRANELSKVYYCSRINLSSCLHSIVSGVPQRVVDIMGVGGFVLSNGQKELAELFDIDREVVAYRSFEELRDKARYYLNHEEQRLEVAMAGYQKVCSCYTYPIAVKTMLSIMGKNI